MFKDTASYDKAIKRIIFLQVLEMTGNFTSDDNYELQELMVAAQMFEDARDAEAKAEYDFMQRFEESFTAQWER